MPLEQSGLRRPAGVVNTLEDDQAAGLAVTSPCGSGQRSPRIEGCARVVLPGTDLTWAAAA